jgi:hypothetical protein
VPPLLHISGKCGTGKVVISQRVEAAAQLPTAMLIVIETPIPRKVNDKL